MPALRIDPATPADYGAFARLFPELGVPDPLPPPAKYASMIAPDAHFARDATGDVVGYTWTRGRGERFYVVHVIVAAAHRRRGVGRALMEAAAARARAAGFTRWLLNVKPENHAARALYERMGMRVAHASSSKKLLWADVARLPPSPGVEVHVLEPDEDARYEGALGLSRGELASARSLVDRIVLGGARAGEPVGVVGFDPTFPGASPFRLRATEDARALLEACHARARPAPPHVRIFVEGDPALDAALEAAGAETMLSVLQMAGDVPAT